MENKDFRLPAEEDRKMRDNAPFGSIWLPVAYGVTYKYGWLCGSHYVLKELVKYIEEKKIPKELHKELLTKLFDIYEQ